VINSLLHRDKFFLLALYEQTLIRAENPLFREIPVMSLGEDLIADFDDDAPEMGVLQRPLVNPLSARRSLERLLEQRALKSRLRDELDDRESLDDLDW
jgi:hypothetical protein